MFIASPPNALVGYCLTILLATAGCCPVSRQSGHKWGLTKRLQTLNWYTHNESWCHVAGRLLAHNVLSPRPRVMAR